MLLRIGSFLFISISLISCSSIDEPVSPSSDDIIEALNIREVNLQLFDPHLIVHRNVDIDECVYLNKRFIKGEDYSTSDVDDMWVCNFSGEASTPNGEWKSYDASGVFEWNWSSVYQKYNYNGDYMVTKVGRQESLQPFKDMK